MTTTNSPPDQPKRDAEKNHGEGHGKGSDKLPEAKVLEATGTKPVDAPDPLSEGDHHPQVVVNPELDPADNKVKLTERNVDAPTPESQREGDVRGRDGGHGGGKDDEKDKSKTTEAFARAAKQKADASLLGAEAGYGGRSGQIAARLRALNVPVIKAEDVGETGVRIFVEPRGGSQAPAVYEASDVDANADWFIGRMRLAGYIV